MAKNLHQINVDTNILMALTVALDFALDDRRAALDENFYKIIKTCLEKFYEMALKAEPTLPAPKNLRKNLYVMRGPDDKS